jgi:hypothetical protein
MMRNIEGRLSKLEDRVGVMCNPPRYLVFIMCAGNSHSQAELDTYVRLLDGAGRLPAGGFVPIDLCAVPMGLNAEEMARYVRDYGAQICGARGAYAPGGPSSK